MKFTCEKSLFFDAINTALRATPAKSPIGSLEGLLIEASNKVKITGYDLKKAIYTKIDADISEPGKIVINAKFLSEMIRRLPDGLVVVTADEQNNTVNIKCGKSEYDFMSLDVREYPEIPKFEELNSVFIPQNILRKMISGTEFAISKEETRPIYTGSLFDIEDGKITVVSVDGYRLAKITETIENGNIENCSFVVPGFSLSDIEKICRDDGDVSISVGERHISFTINDTVVITRRLEGEFLNYKKSIPELFKYNIKVNRQELISVIDRVSLMLNEKNKNPLRMNFNDGKIDCLSFTPIGKAEDICLCEGNGDGMIIGVNDKYMMDALKAASGENLLLCLNTSSSPCIIKAEDGTDNFIYMVLPVRIPQ